MKEEAREPMTARQTTQPSLAQASNRHESFVQADYKAPPDDSHQAAPASMQKQRRWR